MILPLQIGRLALPTPPDNPPLAPASAEPLLDAVRNGQDAREIVRQTAEYFGCEHFQYALFPGSRRLRGHGGKGHVTFVYATMQPAAWAAHWDACDYRDVDPGLSHLQSVAARNLPVIWSRDALCGQSPRLDAFLDDAVSFGVGGSVSFALPESRAYAAVGTWSFAEPNPAPVKMATLRRYIGEMALWTHYFHDAVIRPAAEEAMGAYGAGPAAPGDTAPAPAQAAAAGDAVILSARQQQCLALLAGGQGIKQIAGTMELTPRGVGGHLSAIREKLRARTNAEAVAMAIREGVIK